MTLVVKGSTASNLTGLPLLKRDPMLRDDVNGGVRFAFDLAFGWSYAAGDPIDGKIVRDTSEHADGKFVMAGGQLPVFSGGGVDLSPVTSRNVYLEIPASVSKSIWDNGQKFLGCFYFKMPSIADWSAGADKHLITFATTSNTWQGSADLINISMVTLGGTKQLYFNRQTALNARDTLVFSSNPIIEAHLGQLCQVAVWRSATQMGLRLKSVGGGFNLTTGAVGADSTLDFSTQTGKLGIGPSWGAPLVTAELAASNFKIYRGFIEALTISGRDPITVLDADWTRTIARGVFS